MKPQIEFSLGAHSTEIDLKKRRKKCKRAVGKAEGDPTLTKGFYWREWADNFQFTPFHLDALKLLKEQFALKDAEAKERGRVHGGTSWEERNKWSEVKRAKHSAKMSEITKKFERKLADIDAKKNALERKLLDHQISTVKERTMEEKRDAEKVAKRVAKADNTIDIDIDAGFTGIADLGGQVAMRVDPNPKCDGCGHYAKNLSACQIGILPAVCGDGSNPEIGFAPVAPDRMTSMAWKLRHSDAVALPAQAEDAGSPPLLAEIPYRIEVLGESSLALSERMTLLKSAFKVAKGSLTKQKARQILHDKEVHGKPLTDRQRRFFGAVASGHARKSEYNALLKSLVEDLTGEQLYPRKEVVLKSTMAIDEFADAMGTTVNVVHEIAKRLGDKQKFASFIKSKLPDIMVAHGLNERDVTALYRAATQTLKSLTSTEWELWKGVSFTANVDDDSLARAIERNGLMDINALYKQGIVTPSEPNQIMPSPQPIQEPSTDPVISSNFVGGNLHLAESMSRA